jgi:hypothetical protein
MKSYITAEDAAQIVGKRKGMVLKAYINKYN